MNLKKAKEADDKNDTSDKQNHERLKCDLPPDEALRRAMMVKPPEKWKGDKRENL